MKPYLGFGPIIKIELPELTFLLHERCFFFFCSNSRRLIWIFNSLYCRWNVIFGLECSTYLSNIVMIWWVAKYKAFTNCIFPIVVNFHIRKNEWDWIFSFCEIVCSWLNLGTGDLYIRCKCFLSKSMISWFEFIPNRMEHLPKLIISLISQNFT